MRHLSFLFFFFFVAIAFSQAPSGYQAPPKAIADLIDAPPTPGVSLSPDNTRMLILDRAGLKSIKELGAAELRLPGPGITDARGMGNHTVAGQVRQEP